MNLEQEIEKAKIACEQVDWKNPSTSIMDKMRPWVHYNNLLVQKTLNLRNYETTKRKS